MLFELFVVHLGPRRQAQADQPLFDQEVAGGELAGQVGFQGATQGGGRLVEKADRGSGRFVLPEGFDDLLAAEPAPGADQQQSEQLARLALFEQRGRDGLPPAEDGKIAQQAHV